MKLGKKHLFSFALILVLLFSFNLNVFASTSHTVHFSDYAYNGSYTLNSKLVDCTSSIKVTTGSGKINGIDLTYSVFTFPTVSAGLNKLLFLNADLNLYTDTNYTYDFYFKSGNNVYSDILNCNFYVYYIVNDVLSDESAVLYEAENLQTNVWYQVSGSFKTANLTGNVKCGIMVQMTCYSTANKLSTNFAVSDCKLVLDDPMLSGTPINTPSTDDVNSIYDDYNNIMDSLPQIDGEELDSVLNFDFRSFTAGMSCVRTLFDRTMSVFGFNAVLTFALAIGLATFIIGRKVGR